MYFPNAFAYYLFLVLDLVLLRTARASTCENTPTHTGRYNHQTILLLLHKPCKKRINCPLWLIQGGSLGAPPFHKCVTPFEGLIYHETLPLVYIIFLETLLSVAQWLDKIRSKWSIPSFHKNSWGQRWLMISVCLLAGIWQLLHQSFTDWFVFTW